MQPLRAHSAFVPCANNAFLNLLASTRRLLRLLGVKFIPCLVIQQLTAVTPVVVDSIPEVVGGAVGVLLLFLTIYYMGIVSILSFLSVCALSSDPVHVQLGGEIGYWMLDTAVHDTA